ncbi:hypothetical protein FQA39_LY01020 [Lamprigera yunnana]|nr:hypothetical protein FQA39_LY01020 [Lamprigera yunnana]
MLYAEQHWTKATDLKSTVHEQLSALEIGVDHKAISGMERYCKTLVSSASVDGSWITTLLDTIKDHIKDCTDSDTSSFYEEEFKTVEQDGKGSETTEEEESKKQQLYYGESVDNTIS